MPPSLGRPRRPLRGAGTDDPVAWRSRFKGAAFLLSVRLKRHEGNHAFVRRGRRATRETRVTSRLVVVSRGRGAMRKLSLVGGDLTVDGGLRVSTALLLAAGIGNRLAPLTNTMPSAPSRSVACRSSSGCSCAGRSWDRSPGHNHGLPGRDDPRLPRRELRRYRRRVHQSPLFATTNTLLAVARAAGDRRAVPACRK